MSDQPIPVICLDPSSVPSLQIFNPNDWAGESKAIVQSCATEYSILQYGLGRIADICVSPNERCQSHFDSLVGQWKIRPWDLEKAACYGQVPELHMLIEAFFSGIKSFLDLAVQLISTEGIVRIKLHGFHEAGSIYGGRVLNSLKNNVQKGKERTAKDIRVFIEGQKTMWIDGVISSRNRLVHPTAGAQQVMFRIVLENHNGNLVYKGAVPPTVCGTRIDAYSATRMEDLKVFALTFFAILKMGGDAA